LHGLNAVYLLDFGWYRIDPREDKPGVEVKFFPPVYQLAFSTKGHLETDLQGIWPEPLPVVVKVLQTDTSSSAVNDHLPDIEVYG